jgi:hypothetical protein
MSIESELLALKTKDDLIIAEEAHEWARKNKASALHKALTWDDKKAAYQHRIWQIRQLIAIHVTYEGGDRRLVSLTVDRGRPGGGYRDISDVLRDQSLHAIMLEDALNELNRVQAKYERLKELTPVWRELNKVRSRRTKRGASERRAAG